MSNKKIDQIISAKLALFPKSITTTDIDILIAHIKSNLDATMYKIESSSNAGLPENLPQDITRFVISLTHKNTESIYEIEYSPARILLSWRTPYTFLEYNETDFLSFIEHCTRIILSGLKVDQLKYKRVGFTRELFIETDNPFEDTLKKSLNVQSEYTDYLKDFSISYTLKNNFDFLKKIEDIAYNNVVILKKATLNYKNEKKLGVLISSDFNTNQNEIINWDQNKIEKFISILDSKFNANDIKRIFK